MSDVVTIRNWSYTDLEDLVKHANNKRIAENLTDAFPFPYTHENGRQFIEMVSKDDPITVFAIDLNGEAIGGIGLHLKDDIYRENAELGYWLSQDHWGKGFMSYVIPLIVKYGFENLPISRIYARPFGTNIASQRVLQKCGFILEASLNKVLKKNDRYEDELIYAIRK